MKKKSVAIITARSGSKRVPKKNIRNFLGKPVILYTIEAALNSECFDEVMVSTDSEEFAKIAIEAGAAVPFLRSEKNSDDFSTTADVIKEVLEEYKKTGKEFEYFCCIYPTAVFITEKRIEEAFKMLQESNADSVFPVTRFSYPIQRSLKIEENNKLAMIWPENLNVRSNDLMPSFQDTGSFYWMTVDKFFKKGTILTDNTRGLVIPESEAQDIDTEEDWKMAEMKYRILRGL